MLRALIVVALAALAPKTVACNSSGSTSPTTGGDGSGGGGGEQAERVPLVPKDHALYNRFEGTTFKNACGNDEGCYRGGCSGETCSAVKDVMGTCDALSVQIPASASCGCVFGQCEWWSDGSVTLAAAEPRSETPVEQPPGEQHGGACGDKTCNPDEQCIEYYGVAGPRGPKFQSCGIPCKNGKCAGGRKCVTIADGPGPVCQ